MDYVFFTNGAIYIALKFAGVRGFSDIRYCKIISRSEKRFVLSSFCHCTKNEVFH